MYARTLGGREIIDAPPTHLQEDERNDEYPNSQPLAIAWELTIMYIYKVCEPSDGSPGLFGVPRPIMSPSLLSPQGTKEHADGHKGKTAIDEIV